MKYLIDTNIISEPVKTHPNNKVMINLERFQNEIAIPSPVWHELQFGCYRLPISKKRDTIQSFLNDVLRASMMILPYDERAASWHAKERARLTVEGKSPSFVDGQIAAIARVNSLILVTRNTDDFMNFSGLAIQNWFN